MRKIRGTTEGWVILATLLFAIAGGTIGYYALENGKLKSQLADKNRTVQQFKPIFAEMAQDPSQQKEYSAIVDGLMPVIAGQVQRDPASFLPFLQSMVQVATSDPGLAISLQNYATSQTQTEMKQIREKYGVDKFIEQQNQFAELQTRLKKKTDEADGLKKENEKLQAIAANSKELVASFGKLQKQTEPVKTAPVRTPVPVKRAAKEPEATPNPPKQEAKNPKTVSLKEVPVALVNPTANSRKTAVFRIVSDATGKTSGFSVAPHKILKTNLLPGKYNVQCKFDNSNWNDPIKVDVSKDASFPYQNQLYHCILTAK